MRLDLADADNPIQLLTAQGGTLPALEQDANVNFVNGVWEMELATFTVGVSALSDVVETFETIVGVKQELAKMEYQSGDTYTIGGVYITAQTNSGGTLAIGTVFVPKKIPSTLTATASGSINNFKPYNASAITGLSLSSTVSILGDNAITITVTKSGLGSAVMGTILPNTITITFA